MPDRGDVGYMSSKDFTSVLNLYSQNNNGSEKDSSNGYTISTSNINVPLIYELIDRDSRINKEFFAIILACLQFNPKKRLGIAELGNRIKELDDIYIDLTLKTNKEKPVTYPEQRIFRHPEPFTNKLSNLHFQSESSNRNVNQQELPISNNLYEMDRNYPKVTHSLLEPREACNNVNTGYTHRGYVDKAPFENDEYKNLNFSK